MGHTIDHPVTDTHEDKYFQINPITREITNTGSTKKITLIKGDHNSEVFTFEVPRIIEGHDMSLCNQVTVHFINIGTNKQESENVYTIWKRNVDDVEPENGVFFDDNEKFGVLTTVDEEGNSLEPENQVVVGTWLISRAATTYRGTLSFVVRFECLSKELVYTLLYEGDVLTLNNGKKVTALENSFVYEDGTDALNSDSDEKTLTLEDGRTISLSEDGYPQVIEPTFPVVYSWSSAIYSKIIVADTHENAEQTLEPYNDVLEAWWDKICQASDTLYAITDDGVLLSVTDAITDLREAIDETNTDLNALEEEVATKRAVFNLTYFDGTEDTIYSSVDDIPDGQRINGHTTLVYRDGVVGNKIDIHSYNDAKKEWSKKSSLQANTIYRSLINNKLYCYTMSPPYLVEVSTSLSDEAKDYVSEQISKVTSPLEQTVATLTNMLNKYFPQPIGYESITFSDIESASDNATIYEENYYIEDSIKIYRVIYSASNRDKPNKSEGFNITPRYDRVVIKIGDVEKDITNYTDYTVLTSTSSEEYDEDGSPYYTLYYWAKYNQDERMAYWYLEMRKTGTYNYSDYPKTLSVTAKSETPASIKFYCSDTSLVM